MSSAFCMLSGNSGTWNPSGARWLPVSWFLFSQLFTEQSIANVWRTGEHLRAFANAEQCSGPWIHAACIQLHVQGSQCTICTNVFFITQILASNALSTTGTQICTVQQGIGV